MQNLQLAVAHINALLGAGQGAAPAATAADASGKDAFASLLDMVGDVSDKANARASDDSAERDDKRPSDPLAAVIEAKEPIRLGREKPKNDTGTTAIRYVSKKIDDTRQPATALKPEKNAGDEEAVPSVAADKVVAAAKNAAAPEADDSSLRDKMQEKIASRIDALSGLMNILATLLAKANGAIAQVTMSSVTAVQANMAAAYETQAADATQSVAAPATAQDVDPLALLTQTHSLLGHIQQLLQADDGQDAVLTPEAQAQLDTLNKALEADLAALRKIFADAPAQEKAPTDGAEVIASQLADAKEALKSDVSHIRDLLQKLKHENPAVFSKPEPHTQHAQPQAPLVDMLSADMQLREVSHTSRHRAEAFAQVVPAAVQIATQPEMPQANANMVATPAANAAVAVGANAKFDSNTSGQGGQPQQGQGGQVFALSGISTQSVDSASASGRSPFSQALHRASQANVSEQVVFHVKTALANGNSKIHIQLAPEELGKLDIKLHVDASGKTGVTIVADTQSTLDLLQKDTQGLQKALADAGLKTDSGSLNFNLRGGQQEHGGKQGGSQAAANYRKSQPEEDINPAAVVRSYTVVMPDGLDIKI